jgi:PAS domain S-box-containing protein
MELEARKTAIDVVGDVPWGTHFCQFYRTREELIDVLVPYFRAGLESNEFCMWITSEPVSTEDARRALAEEVEDLEEYVRKGQIEIVDHGQWYTRAGRFDPEEVLRGWSEKEQFALEKGFDGLRITANISWLEKGLWGKFTNYEAAAHESIARSRMLAMCAYSLDKCSASDIVDVVSNHQFALIRQDGAWRIIESPAHKQAYEALQLSEQRYALAQRAANIGSWDWNIVTGDLHWSDRVEPLFGYAPGQFGATYAAFLKCVHPDDRRHVVDSVNASVEQGGDYAIEHRIVWPDGTVRWVAETGDVIRDEQGKAIRMLGIVQDITERKDAEDALRASVERYRSYIEVTGQLGWTTNAGGEIEQDIPTWRQFTGQSKGEVRGWGWSKALHPDDRERAEQSWSDAVKARRTYEVEYRIRRHDGIYRQFLARSVPVIEEDGTVREWVGTCVDVTERKGAERELRLRNRIAQVFLTIADDRMYGEVLDVLRESCESEYGFFGYIDENGDLVSPSLTRDIWDRCEMADKTIVFARETWGDSIWGRAMTSGKSQLSNTPLNPPEGHVKIDRALNVPVIYDGNSIGIISLANKRADYTPDDLRLLESIADFIAPVLHARLQRKRDLAQIESLARFSSENPNPVLRIATDGTVLYANSAGSRLIATWGRETGEQAPENWRQYIARILESGENEALEAFCGERIFSLIMAPVKDAGYANVYGIDVTERRRAEESLREYRHHLEELVQTRTAELTQANERLLQENEERKRLEKEILNISERERRRIGRELHDSIGQQFTGIAFMMKVLEQKLADKLPDKATDAQEIKKLVNQAMDQTRGLAKGLHPIDLDAGSLTAALQELATTTESMFGVRCDLKCDEFVPVDDAEIATHLYRITQEAITNAIKHGRAKNIQVEFACKTGKAVLSVENDGLDFPEKLEPRGTGMGLQIMDHRADIIGALLEITKAPQGGTIVTCSWQNNAC